MSNALDDSSVKEKRLICLAKLRAEVKKCRYLYERHEQDPSKVQCFSTEYMEMIKAEEALEKCLALIFDEIKHV